MSNKTSIVNFRWPQGEDLVIELAYKEGDNARRASLLHLSAGYDVRMDVVSSTKQVIYSATTQAEDVVLTNTAPNVTIVLPRSLTLPGGPVAQQLNESLNFSYDIFLRNTLSNRQVKILQGSLSVERSNTLWA